MPRTPGGAGDGTATTDGALLSIGAVLGQLRAEFPEVTISKIRFLEAEGLVEPQRTPSGYRKFAEEDVRRLAYVLRMQRDHYLPLRVIKEHLEGLDRGEQPALPGRAGDAPAQPQEAPESALRPPQELRVGRAELLAATGAEAAELDQWESYGLVEAGGDGGYDPDTVVIGRLIADLGRHGLEPRHLRAVKAAADREAGLVEQLVAPLRRHRNPQTRRHAEITAEELAELSVRLHAAMVRSALRLRLR
ncbi:MerR family transcriptional regulator [Streptomyces cocklensis]|uniref:MerR family regulatory protein n=1 Tax=Actinacidiphila cocklensis TaxID=887465 RepID=A0A9W4GWW6_9ACTN|nr:MerR family transcriptional regulator [Actinacidiphila cocklensis]MDD1063740.1 MerR family transcriptional regulator [Actinacidiphila cocklensis]WSX73095.1 MerR family transcriptional regulator [Streptomyces sp. NBC_00899]WSX80839.1 MerR family transcriptional regulator [Streptomyces sp. NBC_00899]CAG6398140.1 MerR family regulatory protein [Actinacidiphila cocklensis]